MKTTFFVRGKGTHGPASPYYNPECTVTMCNAETGATLFTTTLPNSYEAHLYAMSRGATLAEGETECNTYKRVAFELGL